MMVRCRRFNIGVTLIEMLVALAITAVLTALALGATAQARESADRVVANANYRQIGLAISLFATDHNGTLPGPLVLSQSPYYNPADTRQLATHLGTYLGVSDPSVARTLDVFISPAYRKDSNVLPSDQAILYVVNNGVQSDGQILTPFGEARAPGSPPMKIYAIPPKTWLLCDADQLNPWLVGQPWANKTPAKPLHSPKRLALFKDGSVATLTDADLQPVRRPPPPR